MDNKNLPLAILWDMDGVLVDTGQAHLTAWRETLAQYGKHYSNEEFKATFGMNNASILRYVFGKDLDPGFVREVGDSKEVMFREIIKSGVRPLPGVLVWLEWFRTHSLKQAVASSAPCENIDALVDALGIRPFFDAIVSGAELPGKPRPDVFLKAARLVGIPPKDCLVIEDAVPGVQAARNAGMKCVAITTTNPAEGLQQADLVLSDLTELTEQQLAALF